MTTFSHMNISLKTKVQTINLRCCTGLKLNWLKRVMANMQKKMQNIKDSHVVGKTWLEMDEKRPFISRKFWLTVSI